MIDRILKAGRPMAVIDVGTTSVRMSIAQVTPDGELETLGQLQQSVSLGRAVFADQEIGRDTIEECVKCLKNFCTVLREYQIPLDSSRVRAVATSAVRDARNRQAFLDRVYIGTGLEVDAIDEAEVSRFTYLCVAPLFQTNAFLRESDALLVEVGGGSTEVLALRNERVLFSEGFRLGSLRMRQTLEDYRAPASRLRDIVENQIQRTMDLMRRRALKIEGLNLMAMGGDTRFAASHLVPDWDKHELLRLPVGKLAELTDGILSHSVDELVRRYHLTYPEAETLGPALLTYVRLAEAMDLRQVLITSVSMRDGVLAEMAGQGTWTSAFTAQIVNSALALGAKYNFDRPHAEQVVALAQQFFTALRKEHRLGAHHELILRIAGLLHEIGVFVSNRSHHKHSMYLIQNSEIFGLGQRDLLLVALVARYHRRATPADSHEGYSKLHREDRIVVSKLASILRMADALDRGHMQRVNAPEVKTTARQMVITVRNAPDLTLEALALDEKAEMFREVYGMQAVLRKEGMRG
ncbi:MAG: HD domain-containing protein [Lentisphaerae bacterium]|nr:HD domain-containing protein [Lentisphaerota bacterium]